MGLHGSFQGHTASDVETYYKATVIKTGQHCRRDGHTRQWNRTQSPEIAPYRYGQLIFDKAQSQFSGEWIVLV